MYVNRPSAYSLFIFRLHIPEHRIVPSFSSSSRRLVNSRQLIRIFQRTPWYIEYGRQGTQGGILSQKPTE